MEQWVARGSCPHGAETVAIVGISGPRRFQRAVIVRIQSEQESCESTPHDTFARIISTVKVFDANIIAMIIPHIFLHPSFHRMPQHLLSNSKIAYTSRLTILTISKIVYTSRLIVHPYLRVCQGSFSTIR